MDKDELMSIMRSFIATIEADGYEISFAGIPPVLPEFQKPYNLQVFSPKLLSLDISTGLSLLVKYKHKLLSLEVRRLISGIQLCRTIDEIACRKEDIIVNTVKYHPLDIPYRFLEMA
jgi:hypothetical protein